MRKALLLPFACLMLCGCSIFDGGIMGVKPNKAEVTKEHKSSFSDRLKFTAKGNTTTPPLQPNQKPTPQMVKALGQTIAEFPPNSKVDWTVNKDSNTTEGLAESIVGSLTLNKSGTILLWVGIVLTIGSIFAIFMIPAGFGKTLGGLGLLLGIGFIAAGICSEQYPQVFLWILIGFVIVASYAVYKIISVSKTAAETPKIVTSIDTAIANLKKLEGMTTGVKAAEFILKELGIAQDQSTKDEVNKCQGKA